MAMLALAGGSVLGYWARQTIAKKQLHTAEGRASKLIEEANQKTQEIIIEAKNKAVTILEEAKKKEQERESQIIRSEERLSKKEESLDRKVEEIDRGRVALERKAEEIRKIRKEVEEARRQELKRLEKIAGLSKDAAKKILLQLTEEESRQLLAKKIKELENSGREELDKKAKDIMTQAIQKYAGSHAADVTTSTVSIPSD